jgi:ribonuclease BN (tRNA processing enzyme)
VPVNGLPTGHITMQVAGCGDAFGTGGKLQTCFLLNASVLVLIDCGASALSGLKRLGVDPQSVDLIVLSHLHGDHFAGVPFLIRETEIAASRRKQLDVVGPEGHEQRLKAAMELLFPGGGHNAAFRVNYAAYVGGKDLQIGPVTVRAIPVRHTKGTNPHAVRLVVDNKVIVYSGDTAWVDGLVELSANADLFICECYQDLPGVPNHMDRETLEAQRSRLSCKKLLLTHHGPEATPPLDSEFAIWASDGMVIPI